MQPKSASTIIKKLGELGIEHGIIYESIITSLNRDGSPHAAAMGMIFEKKGDSILIKIRAYTSSKTGQNLSLTHLGVANITDPELLIEIALDMCPEIKYVNSCCISVPRISRAAAWIEFKVIDICKNNEINEFTCMPLHVDYFEVRPKPYTRAVHALVEAAIHASRINPYKELGDVKKVSELRELIDMNLKIVERIAPRSRYMMMANKIKTRYF